MSTSLSAAGNLVTIYLGTPILVAGVVGDLLNAIVFLSLRTFRQSSCALYLTSMSILNLGELLLSLLPRIMVSIWGFDGTESSAFYCKFRIYFIHVCVGGSLTCFCLATIDQYFATCSRLRWQQWCNIKLAQRIIITVIIIWILHGILYLVFYDLVKSPITNKASCINTNYIFIQYRACFIILVLFGYLPITIAAIFGSMAFYNVQQMAFRHVPLVRRELEKQLTIMVLVQVIVNIFTLLPFTTVNAVATNPSFTANQNTQAKLNFAVTVTVMIFFIFFASPFYIYICASERFRKQLIYVLFTMHLNRWKRPRVAVNQVMPVL